MANGISTTLRLIDQMTAPLLTISNAVNAMVAQFDGVENAANLDTAAVERMQGILNVTNAITEQVKTNLELTDRIEGNSVAQSNFNSQINQGSSLADQLGGKIKQIAGYMGVGLGIKAAVNWVKDSLDLTNQQINAEQQLANVLANVGASEADFVALKQEAANIQSKTVYGDEALIGGAAELSTYIKDAEALKNMMGTLSNYAAGMSGGGEVGYQQMVDYATQLGKALDGTYDGLKKKGFELTEQQKQIIENGSDMEKALVIDEVISQSWAGLAEQMAQTPQGMQIAMNNAIGDIRENIGASLYPAIMMIFSFIQEHLPQIEQMLYGFVPIIETIINVIGGIVEAAFAVYDFFVNNWSLIEPVIWGLVAAFLAWKAITIIQTAVQWLLNSALLANPITWIVIAIAAVIAAIVAWANAVGGFRVLWLVVVNAILTAWDWIKIGFFTGVYWVLDLWDKMSLGMRAAGVAIANFMGDMKANVLMILQNMVNGAIDIINGFIKMLNKIPFVNIGLIEQVSFGTEAQLANEAEKQARNQGLADARAQVDAAITERAGKLDAMKEDARAATADRLAGIADAQAAAQQTADYEAVTTPSDYVNTNFGGETGAIADNTADIAGNTKKTADFSEENVKLWRDIAERDTINRFTTAEITVEMGGVTNNVSSEMDLDGIINYLADGVNEALYEVAGVYS